MVNDFFSLPYFAGRANLTDSPVFDILFQIRGCIRLFAGAFCLHIPMMCCCIRQCICGLIFRQKGVFVHPWRLSYLPMN